MSITIPSEIQQMISKQDHDIAELTAKCQQLNSTLIQTQESCEQLKEAARVVYNIYTDELDPRIFLGYEWAFDKLGVVLGLKAEP